MDYNWTKIREKMFAYCSNAFQENSITLTTEETHEAIGLFYNFVNFSVPYGLIKGIGKDINMYNEKFNEDIRAKGRNLEGFDKDYLRSYLLGKL